MNLFGSDSRPWVTVVAGAAVLGLNLLFLVGGYAAVMRRRTGRPVPEGNARIWTSPYSAATLRRYLLDAGEGGWLAYRLQLWWDIAYAVLLGSAGAVLVDGVLGRSFGGDRWWLVLLVLAPTYAAAADVLEDALLLRAVGRGPTPGPDPPLPRPGLVPWACWFTRGKFALYGLSGLLLIIGTVRLIQRGP